MAVFAAGQTPPSWCELAAFEIVALGAGEERPLARPAERIRVLVTDGTIQAVGPQGSTVLKQRQFLDLEGEGWLLKGIVDGSGCVVLHGRWGDEMAGCGLFEVRNDPHAKDKGDPVPYPKSTSLDSHYHDCDEYWIILEGAGTAVVGGRHHKVKGGDCVAIGMGHHHDFPQVTEPVRAIFFETTLEGQKRIGHLWEHTHGPASPKEERV